MSEQVYRIIPNTLFAHPAINFKTTFSNCVLSALLNRGWTQVEDSSWHLQWSEKERVNDVFEQGMKEHQRCNHFRLWGQLCRKDMMVKNIRKFKRELQRQRLLVEEDWNFYPLTFFLPSQYTMFAEEFRKRGGLWIMKPTSRCQGKGIFIIDSLSQVAPFKHRPPVQTPPPIKSVPIKKKEEKSDDSSDNEQERTGDNEAGQAQSYLIQQYLARPLLFGRKKFDLRVYCLCTSYSQLTAWMYRQGFARFTHEPYDPDNFTKLDSHLTNVQIQKHSENYDEVRGGKWLIDRFKHYMTSKFGSSPVEQCFSSIRDIIVRSLQAVQKSILPSKNSFQLYGYDFMIDEGLKPWLIEVNGGPSMTANTEFDSRLKCGLIDDALSVVDLEGVLSGQEHTVGGFDLIVSKGTKVCQASNSSCSSLLGAKNQRTSVMRKIATRYMAVRRSASKKLTAHDEKPKAKGKEEKISKEKLLPGFYYKRKQEIKEDTKEQLVQEVIVLQKEVSDDTFKPLSKRVTTLAL